MASKNEVAKTQPTFSMALTTKLNEVTDALPADFNKQRFVQNCIALLNENKNIAKFPQAQIMQGLLKGAFLGLDFFNKECYLIGYGSDLSFQTDYKGETKLVKKYSIRKIKDIYSEVVREGDDFSVSVVNGERTVNFNPAPFNSNKIIGAFAVCQFEDGGFLSETMSLAELENTRRHSKASNSMAWKDFTSEMYRKTVLRRLCKHIEIDFDSPDQIKIFNETMAMAEREEVIQNDIDENANTVVFDVEGVEVVDSAD